VIIAPNRYFGEGSCLEAQRRHPRLIRTRWEAILSLLSSLFYQPSRKASEQINTGARYIFRYMG